LRLEIKGFGYRRVRGNLFMDKTSILFSKIAALKKSFDTIDYSANRRALGTHVIDLFPRYQSLTKELRELLPDLYSDLPEIKTPDPMNPGPVENMLFAKDSITPFVNSLDYILEVRANFRVAEKVEDKEKPKRIFISHGRSKEWYKVQTFLEKDLNLQTLELAQEANLGRTVLQKLSEESDKCGFCIIVMSGDDVHGDEVRARENVLHEIGFFQGKYGLQNIVLLHEEGVNIPSNIHGLVYISFPKDTVEATFAGVQRELKILMA
jgi:hypothetical protein